MPVVNASLHFMERIAKSSLTLPHNICDELSACLGKPCRLSLRLRFELMSLAKGDLLVMAESACIVSACVAYGLEFELLVHPMVLLEISSATTSRWQRLGDLLFLPLTKGVARNFVVFEGRRHHRCPWSLSSHRSEKMIVVFVSG